MTRPDAKGENTNEVYFPFNQGSFVPTSHRKNLRTQHYGVLVMHALVAADEVFVQQAVGQIPWGGNRLVVEYALRDVSKPIGVSEYSVSGSVRDGVVPSLPDPFATAYRR